MRETVDASAWTPHEFVERHEPLPGCADGGRAAIPPGCTHLAGRSYASRRARAIIGVGLLPVLLGLFGGCDDPTDGYLNSCKPLPPGEHTSEHLAGLAGTYEVWWVPADGGGVPCEAPVSLHLNTERVANIEAELCQQRYQFFDASKRAWVWASEVAFNAGCQLEGFSATTCTVRMPEPAAWLLSGTYLGIEFEEGATLAVQWSTRGEFQFGTIRNADGLLLAQVCSAPLL